MKSISLPVLRQVIPVTLRMTETTIQENTRRIEDAREEIVTMSEVIVITSGKGGVRKPQLSPISEQVWLCWAKKLLWLIQISVLRNLDVVLGPGEQVCL